MNMIETAKELGFSGAAVIDTAELVFIPEYRVFCEENLCGNYDLNPACPPESGTVEEMKAHALTYKKTLVLQTTQGGQMDYKKAKLAHNHLTEELAENKGRRIRRPSAYDCRTLQRQFLPVRLLHQRPDDGRYSRDDLLE